MALRWLRPRIGLRTLFVLLTLACVWLGYNVSVVRARQALHQQVLREGWMPSFLCPSHGRKPQVSYLRRKLGDRNLETIVYPSNVPPDRLATFQRYFPETRTLPGGYAWQDGQRQPVR